MSSSPPTAVNAEPSTNGLSSSTFEATNPSTTKSRIMTLHTIRDRSSNYFHRLKQGCVLKCPNAIHLSFWLIGFLVMVGLTTKDLIPILDDYKYNNLAAQMDLRSEQIVPNFTICLPYYSRYLFDALHRIRRLDQEYLNGTKNLTESDDCAHCFVLQEAGWAFWTNMTTAELSSTKAVVKYVVKRFYDERWDLKKELHGPNFYYMQFLSDAVWYYFYWIYRSDLDVLTSQDFIGLKDIVDDWISHEALDWMPRHAVDTLYEILMNYLSTCIFGECTERNSSDLNFDHKFPGFRLRSNRTVTIYGDQFCFPAPTDRFGSKDFTCSYSRWPFLWNRYERSAFEIYSSPAVLYGTVQYKDSIYSTTYPTRKNDNESEYVFVTYGITQRTVANSLSKDPHLRSCSDESSVEACVAKGQATVRECGCVPFTFRTLLPPNNDEENTSNMQYCNSTVYNWCSKKIRMNLDRLQTKCKNKCEYTFFEFDSKQSVKYNYYNDTVPQFMVTFSSAKTPYVVFRSEVKTTPSQFVSQIGGVVNLYLGVSGLTIFALLILCFDQSRTWHKENVRRVQKQKAKRRLANSFDVWQFLRVVGVFHSTGQIDGKDEKEGEEEKEDKNDERMDRLEANMGQQIDLSLINQNLEALTARMLRLEGMMEKLASREIQKENFTRL